MLMRDNQQVTRGWFTAILEGEGSFYPDREYLTISNTDKDIAEACARFLSENHIYYVLSEYYRKSKYHNVEYVIRISNSNRNCIFRYCEELYKLIEPDLQCRRIQYEKLLGTSTTARPLSVDLDWLIGIFEAEGSFSLVLDNRRQAALGIRVTTTNENILHKVILIFRYYGISYYITPIYKRLEHHTPQRSIHIAGMKRCDRFLRLTRGRWLSDRNIKRSELMKEFIDLRFQMRLKDPYSERQFQIIQAMSDLNR